MCVIAIYEGIHAPKITDIKDMINANPDGVGVAWNDGERVHFRKGLETAEQVMDIYEAIKDEALGFVVHCRIATSGGVSPNKCHPFPVTIHNQFLNITTYDGRTPCAIHNGVFDIDVEDGLNDTQTLIKKVIAPVYRADVKGFERGRYSEVVKMATKGSRFVIMYPSHIEIFGRWNERDGVLFSNLLWTYRAEWHASKYGWHTTADGRKYYGLPPVQPYKVDGALVEGVCGYDY